MKLLTFFLFTVLTAYFGPLQAQYFEGKLTYKITYDFKDEEGDHLEKEQKSGNLAEYYIKNGNYKSIRFYNDSILSISTYSPSENRIYTDKPTDKYVFWQDCSYDRDTLVDMRMSEEVIVLNGYECKTLTIVATKHKITYWTTDQMSIGPGSFSNHEMGFWQQKIEMIDGALDVKIIHEYEDYTSTWELVEVEDLSFEDSVWQINKSKISMPSPREQSSAPKAPGGYESFYKCIHSQLRYPKTARKADAQGKVFIRFLVNEDGSLSDAEVVKGVHPDIDAEAARVIMACPKKWTPAYVGEEPVKCPMILPITFRL